MEMFGRWKWNGEAERRPGSMKTVKGRQYQSIQLFYKVSCTCGSKVTKWVSRSHLVRGASCSCGCLQKEMTSARIRKFYEDKPKGNKHHPLYEIWNGMHQRCENPKATGYKNYGGRGIKICQLWSRSNPDGFKNFCDSLGDRPSSSHTIDRINNDGDYEPGNVKWSTMKDQLSNRRELPSYRKTSLHEPPGEYGNWIFNGEVVRKYDCNGISVRYFKVVCRICGQENLARKQDLKNGKSTKCKACAVNLDRKRDERGRLL